jgi:FkbM family methyltransferase
MEKLMIAVALARGKTVTLGGRPYRVKGLFPNPIASRSNKWANSEIWLDMVFRSIFANHQGVFLDVGANLGQTLFKVLTLDHQRRYIGFEPQVPCCFMLQNFIEQNQLTQCSVLSIGLSNANQLVKLHVSGNYDSTASVVGGFRPDAFYSSSRYVSLRKGDEVVQELGINDVACIKVDVEGAELEVFEGLQSTLAKKRPFLVFEVLNHFLATGVKLDAATIEFRESRLRRMETLLKDRDYTIYNIQPGNLTVTPTIIPATSGTQALTNYVAMPQASEPIALVSR